MIETLERTPSFVERATVALEEALHGADGARAARRRQALEAFARLGLPSRKNEAWKYTPIERALRHGYAFATPTEAPALDDAAHLRLRGLEAPLLVVVNGVFAPELSDLDTLPAGVEARSLRQTLATDPALVEDHFGRYAPTEEDAFVALNTAFEPDGLFLRIAPGTALEHPIQVAFVTTAEHDVLLQTRNLYLVGERAEAIVVETFHAASGPRTFTNAVTEALVERGARVHLLKLEVEGEDASRIETLHAHQQAQSFLATHTYTLGGRLVRNNASIVSGGEDAETHLYGLYVLRGDQHVDNHTLIDHAAPRCFSNELYRGVLDERATGVFNGKVFVRRNAQQINAYQSSQGVVLSDDARHYAKPELEIYADDVKCSHGSTTGELEPEHVFYLRSRGLDETTAKMLLLYAFASDIVAELPHDALRTYLDGLIEARLNLSASR